MKLLTLIRHGKSSWDDYTLSDHDRPLLKVGENRTRKVAEYLKKRKFKVDLIISSTAVRAYETSKIIAEAVSYDTEKIVKSEKLYHAGEHDIYNELFSIPNDVNSVLMFGHNPTFTDFVNIFLDREIYNLPTSGLVSIAFKTDRWEDIVVSNHKINFTVTPKEL